MKPTGLSMSIGGDAGLGFSVNQPSRTDDAIWEAVEVAIREGWEPKQFREEAADAWKEQLRQEGIDAANELNSQ